ncbi:BTB POZ domain-containing protein [Mactra antiquata]
MARQGHEDWQSKKTVTECNQYMWINKLGCDVTFIVGPGQTRIGAHKYVLASRSSVFYAMFFGPFSGNTGDFVTIPDMTADQFNCLLDFLYTEKVGINLQNVLAMLYAAKKYCVQSLIDRCLNTLKRCMRPENVCTVMENAHIYGNNELKSKCYNLIMLDPEEVFKSEDLGELCDECFGGIISDDILPLPEDRVFEAVIKYGNAKCKEKSIEPTSEVLREVLKNVLPKVRFPLMDEQFFSDHVESTGLLDEKQVLQIYRYFIKKQVTACPDFNTTKRKCQYTAMRFTDIVSGWGYKRDNRDAIGFKCSRNILVTGLYLYGSDQATNDLDIHINLRQQPYGVNAIVQRFMIESDGKQKTYKLMFDQPAVLNKDKLYNIEAVIRGATTYYGSGGQAVLEMDQVTFTFENTDRSTNNTCIERGQIPGIVYELVPEGSQ